MAKSNRRTSSRPVFKFKARQFRAAGGRSRRLGIECLEPRNLFASLTGTLQYKLPANRYLGGVVKPLPISDAKVEIVGTMVDTDAWVFTSNPTYTSDNGSYNILLPQLPANVSYANINITLDVYATTKPGPTNIAPYAVFTMGSRVVPAEFKYIPQSDFLPATGSELGLINDNSRGSLGTTVFTAASGPTPSAGAIILEEFDIFEALHYGYAYYQSLVPAGDPGGVKVFYDPDNTQPVYSFWNQSITLGPVGKNGIYTWQAILHEYGHYISDINGFYSPEVGGLHNIWYNLRTEPTNLKFNQPLPPPLPAAQQGRSQISIATGRRIFLEENFGRSSETKARTGAVVE